MSDAPDQFDHESPEVTRSEPESPASTDQDPTADSSGPVDLDPDADPQTATRPQYASGLTTAAVRSAFPSRAARAQSTRIRPRRRYDDGFGRAAAFTVLGTVVPGAGLLAARRRVAGGVVLGIYLAVLAALLVWVLTNRGSLGALVTPFLTPSSLTIITVALIVVAVLWVGVVVVTHLALRPQRPARTSRVLGGILVGVLCFAVAAPMAVASRYSYDQIGVVNTVFKSDGQSATRPTLAAPQPGKDPWADTARVNVLLLGGDSGADRTGTRTDSVIVASIDTKTGDTTLMSLPRNTARMPFPKDSALHKYYPNGFTDGNGDDAEFFLNAMYDNVPEKVPADVLGKTDNLGADVMKLSVGEALGLKIDYYVLIDFKGFRALIDALGGITVNLNSYVARGGNSDLHIPPANGYLHPGANQHLDGTDALWFARGRYGADDFQRMDRQRCVINAIIDKANPANLLTRYEKIANAGKAIIKTDIPQNALPAMVELGTRVQGGNVRSVVFKNGVKGFSSPRPDFAQMRARVKSALGETKDEKPSGNSTGKPKASTSPGSEDTSDTSSDNITDACAFDAAAAASAVKPS